MSDEIRASLSSEFPEGLTDCWRCPKCGMSQGIGYPGRFVGIPWKPSRSGCATYTPFPLTTSKRMRRAGFTSC